MNQINEKSDGFLWFLFIPQKWYLVK